MAMGLVHSQVCVRGPTLTAISLGMTHWVELGTEAFMPDAIFCRYCGQKREQAVVKAPFRGFTMGLMVFGKEFGKWPTCESKFFWKLWGPSEASHLFIRTIHDRGSNFKRLKFKDAELRMEFVSFWGIWRLSTASIKFCTAPAAGGHTVCAIHQLQLPLLRCTVKL